MTCDLFEYDKSFNLGLLAGVDEAGRGPLAGPVVTACCMLPTDVMIDGINDSKKLSERARERLYDQIIKRAVFRVSIVPHSVIDEINILEATKKGMKDCIKSMPVAPQLVLVDAVKLNADVPCRAIVKGDAISYNIAAASIIAKVTRDRLMREFDALYPQYGFARNKGYGTREHIEALKACGPSPIHRRTFTGHFVSEAEYDKYQA
ncbi:MAG: ribonuclease HII [Christensenellales bacterium]|jgi:ribonuclease HII